jgi:D-methionine transport system ATP-binding protein
MIFQHFNLLSSRTVFENVALPLELAGASKRAIADRVRPLLDLVGLADLADRYPAQVSGGQKQRIGIARALANQPKVLLSDEATSALDPETTRSILALLADINRKLGVTIVLITHQMRVAQQVCHRLAVMERGRVAEVGETLALFERPESEAARTLVQDVVRQNLPREAVQAARRRLAGREGRLWRLAVRKDTSDEPLISRLVRDFGLDIEVLQGHVDEIRGVPFGALLVMAAGQHEQLALALADLRARGFGIEEVEDDA